MSLWPHFVPKAMAIVFGPSEQSGEATVAFDAFAGSDAVVGGAFVGAIVV